MIPESIRSEIEAHGGLVGTEGPDANGITTYHAADGSYVTVRADGTPAMRGFRPPDPAATQQAPEQSAQPVAPSAAPPRGGAMDQQQMEALLQQVAPNNDVRRLVHTTGSKEKRVPGLPGMGDKVVRVTWHKWVDPGTGHKVEAEVDEGGGSYTVTHNGIDKQEQGAAATKPEDQQTGTKKGDTRGPQTGPIREVWDGEKWIVEPNPTYQAPKPESPKPEKAPDGSYGYWDIKPGQPPKWVPISNAPGPAAQTPVEINGQWGVWQPGANGGPPTFKPIQGVPGARSAEPPGAPTANLTLGQITQGLSDYSSWLTEQVRLWQTSGGKEGMSPDAATKAMETRRGLASSAISEQTGIANAQGEIRSQDITQRGQTLGETRSRRDTGREIYTNTLNQFVPQMKFLAPGQGAAFVGAMDEVNRNAIDYMRSVGGFRESPEVGTVGFLQDVRNMAGPGAAPGGGPPTFGYRATDGAAPAAAMSMGAPAPDPAAAMAEAARQQAMAGSVPAPPPTPAAVNPVSTAPITPPVRPMPTPPPPMAPPVRDDWRSDPGLTPLPAAPTPDQYQPAQPINLDPAQGPVGMRPTFLAPARFGMEYDPASAAMERIMNGANPDIVAEAFELQYGRPLQMAG